jgi:hypothetical protein
MRIIFHAAIAKEKVIKKILKALPMSEKVRGGGTTMYKSEVDENQIREGKRE